MKKRFAELYDSAKDPYDVMLDEYEPGMTRAALDPFLSGCAPISCR